MTALMAAMVGASIILPGYRPPGGDILFWIFGTVVGSTFGFSLLRQIK